MTEKEPVELSELTSSRNRAVSFLLDNISTDGRVAGFGAPRVSYYRVPWALQVAGESEAALRVLSWIEREALGADGSFHGGVDWDAEANAITNSYPETILAYGAVLLRRPDIARRAFGFSRQFQDPVTGGVFMDRDRMGPDGPQLLFLTAQYGMSAVMLGDLASALMVGRWFANLWEAQPELPDRLYTIWTGASGLVIDPEPGEDRLHYVNESQQLRQLHYNGGIAAAFLAHLFMATGDDEWLALAKRFQQFSMDSTGLQFETKQVCKSAWGAGLIFLSDKDQRYVPWIARMANWFVSEQEADGGWSNTRYLDPNPTPAARVEITAEFVVHLDTTIGALASFPLKPAVIDPGDR